MKQIGQKQAKTRQKRGHHHAFAAPVMAILSKKSDKKMTKVAEKLSKNREKVCNHPKMHSRCTLLCTLLICICGTYNGDLTCFSAKVCNCAS